MIVQCPEDATGTGEKGVFDHCGGVIGALLVEAAVVVGEGCVDVECVDGGKSFVRVLAKVVAEVEDGVDVLRVRDQG